MEKSAIRMRRESERLSLRATAKAADIAVNHLSRVERGLASMSISSMLRLAKVLKVNPEWLAEQLAVTEKGRR